MAKVFDFKAVTAEDLTNACAAHATGGARAAKAVCAFILQGKGLDALLLPVAAGYGVSPVVLKVLKEAGHDLTGLTAMAIVEVAYGVWAGVKGRKDQSVEKWVLAETLLPLTFVSHVKRLLAAEPEAVTAMMTIGFALHARTLTAAGVPTLRVKGPLAGAKLPVATATAVTTLAAAERPVSATTTIGDALLVVQGLRASAPKWTADQAMMTQIDELITQLLALMMGKIKVVKGKVEAKVEA